ncbi:MAG: ABC transporter permease subunit [Acidocella sp.]|nr:ABC transporter permease subunit [Acidocella sp.]
MLLLVLAFLSAPLWALIAGGNWRGQSLAPGDLRAVATSLLGGGIAVALIAVVGTPMALYLARTPGRISAVAEALVLIPMLMPTLALGLLLASFYGPAAPIGAAISRLGIALTNSPAAFILAAVYAALPTYIIAARAALTTVPETYEHVARSLGDSPAQVFFRTTLPLAQRGLASALALCWVRALGEFGIVLIIAYYPAGMPVQLWTDVQDLGVQSVFPLLALFLLATLPLPLWLGLRARRRP